MNDIVYFAHAFSCFFMTGLIWLIQLIHYPAFHFVKPELFASFHRMHSYRITFIVGPAMLLEMLTGINIFFLQNMNLISSLNLISLAILWLGTLCLSVPAHNSLALGYNEESLRFLINTNWVRTVAWTLRSVLIIYFTLSSGYL